MLSMKRQENKNKFSFFFSLFYFSFLSFFYFFLPPQTPQDPYLSLSEGIYCIIMQLFVFMSLSGYKQAPLKQGLEEPTGPGLILELGFKFATEQRWQKEHRESAGRGRCLMPY